MDLSNMSEVEIKAAIYDQMALIERCQMNIKALNEELAKRAQQPPKPEKKESLKKKA